MKAHQLPPNAGRVITSLRDAGYDFLTAVADVVDNSIAAKASFVVITSSCDPQTGEIAVSIADNGIGMTPSEVQNAMTYGSKEREDVSSLGKFGLGLKTASTSQCREVSLLSRDSGSSEIYKLTLDIDHAQETNRWEYLETSVTPLERRLLNAAASDVQKHPQSGTLVRWERCDRVLKNTYKKSERKNQKSALDRKMSALRFHLGIVFHRFLDLNDHRAPNVTIKVNDKRVTAWDPFCRQIKGTEKARSKSIRGRIAGGKKGTVVANAYVVPARDELSLIDENTVFPKGKSPDRLQGIYVYRENRLIHWGDWCGLRKTEFHTRLCRIELSFGGQLDELFKIDFKKSSIEIDPDIADVLMREVIKPACKRAEERYRSSETKQVQKDSKHLHVRADTDLSKQANTSRSYQVTKLKNGKSKITNQAGKTYVDKQAVIKNDGVITVSEIPEGLLWQPRIAESTSMALRTSVEINSSHPFYRKAYTLCKKNPNAIKALDYLLWALANAEYASKDQQSLDNFEDMRRDVSRVLKTLAEQLPEPKAD